MTMPIFTLYCANCRENETNCLYPHKIEVSDKESPLGLTIVATNELHDLVSVKQVATFLASFFKKEFQI